MDERQYLIQEIELFCNQKGIAESTFGRQSVNDGKFVGRLRDGKGVTTATVAKVRRYLVDHGCKLQTRSTPAQNNRVFSSTQKKSTNPHKAGRSDFRFYDNRQKYLLFVNTCSEKWAVAERVGMELAHINPQPPALRVFDAGMGDGTVLTNVMRHKHLRLPNLPVYLVGKEIS